MSVFLWLFSRRRRPLIPAVLACALLVIVALAYPAAAQNDQTDDATGGAGAASAEGGNDYRAHLPILFLPLTPPTFNLPIRPNAANNWTVSWTPQPGISYYELQEAPTAAFTNPNIIATTATSQTFAKPPSINNEFFYRVRTVAPDGTFSLWSAVTSVVGAYRDDFNDASSGWEMRRTTYLEKVRGFYETNQSWYVVQIDDRRDWGLFAPMKKAPAVPYAIEFRSQAANVGLLLSHGAVYAGDWNGLPCIDLSSFEGIYQGTNCFNHFYNSNILITFQGLKLLWERVDRLVWCPECGGSPMKRLGDDVGAWPERDPIPNTNAPGSWNTWRIEVRQDGARLFANGQQVAVFPGDRWLSDPYFGLFASTDNFNNSTWRIDYYQVTPLDQ